MEDPVVAPAIVADCVDEIVLRSLPFSGLEDARMKEAFYGTPYIMRLPQELLDAIIDCLRKEKRALANCAATMRRWLYRARRHLFDNISIKHVHAFFAFLQTAPQSVAGNIKFLTLRLHEDHHLDLRTLASALAKMPALDQLWIRHASSMTIPDAVSTSVPRIAQLDILVIDRSVLSAVELATLISLFPSVTDLYIEADCTFTGAATDALQEGVRETLSKVKLTKLAVGARAHDHEAVLNVLRLTSSVDPLTVTSLELNFMSCAWLSTAQRALSVCGPGVEDLAVDLTFWDEDDAKHSLKGLGLSACKKLRRLRLDLSGPEQLQLVRDVLFDVLPRECQPGLRVDLAVSLLEIGNFRAQWDSTLSAYGVKDISAFRLWCRTASRIDDRSNAFKRGRLLEPEEQAQVLKLLPETHKLGTLKFA
ncbi:hypothetical protein PsYK624_103570 [Phanerochaete sordida]|uniref:F-box domain-containing protein n=1 Tax=Phanerochaete sordida TaxID=48140 RepID=A0A9P3GIG1_9APHY|nr:hypothetical protein PsYK624_103570 [Phanerochaete sordida]